MTFKNKNFFFLTLVLALVACALTSCGSENPRREDPRTPETKTPENNPIQHDLPNSEMFHTSAI